MTAVKLVLAKIDSYSVISFYRKSGRIMFKPTAPNPPKPKVYLDAKRIRRMWRIIPRKVLLNTPPCGVLVEYETENPDYYRKFTIDPREVEEAVKRGEVELRETGTITIITEWDADEPVAWYDIDIRTGRMTRGTVWDELG